MGRALPILLLAAAAAAAPARARGQAQGEGGATDAERQRAAERAAEEALEAELEGETRAPSLALGPARAGRLTLGAEVGWLRTGLRFDLGIASRVDLVARVDTMLLYDALSGQNGVALGLRATPLASSRVRASGEVTIGQLFSPTGPEVGNLTALRAEAAVGALAGPATAYARGAVRGLRTAPAAGTSWSTDQEVGLGLEAHRGRWIGGAEWYWLFRPDLDTLSQWRVRLGLAL